jgi:hypothetical protein
MWIVLQWHVKKSRSIFLVVPFLLELKSSGKVNSMDFSVTSSVDANVSSAIMSGTCFSREAGINMMIIDINFAVGSLSRRTWWGGSHNRWGWVVCKNVLIGSCSYVGLSRRFLTRFWTRFLWGRCWSQISVKIFQDPLVFLQNKVVRLECFVMET